MHESLRRSLAALVLLATAAPTIAIAREPDCRDDNSSYLRACPIESSVAGSLSGPEDQDAYSFEVLDREAEIRIDVGDASPGLRLRLLDWTGRTMAETSTGAGTASTTITSRPPAPGTYFAIVDAPLPPVASQSYRLAVEVTYERPPPRILLSRAIVADNPPTTSPSQTATTLASGRYTVQTRQGGTPGGGVAVIRVLALTDGVEASDFSLTADARIERASGSAAIQIRFRYRPEAGGGSGYILAIEPFDGRLRLSAFEEGQQQALTDWVAHPAARANFDTMRVGVRAVGDEIVASVNAQELIRVADGRYSSGALTVGAVTYSAPVTATFENVLVTAPSR